jgi:hypothetical protein
MVMGMKRSGKMFKVNLHAHTYHILKNFKG